jgi:hypothetical protein
MLIPQSVVSFYFRNFDEEQRIARRVYSTAFSPARVLICSAHKLFLFQVSFGNRPNLHCLITCQRPVYKRMQ